MQREVDVPTCKDVLGWKIMQYIKGIENYKNDNETAITLGKFDGLHQGHELLISRVIEHQKHDRVDGVVFVFDMNPLYQKTGMVYERLLSNEEKVARLDERVDYFVECPFVDDIAKIEPEVFIEDILVKVFNAKYVVVGTDFRFGYNRRGDVKMLKEYSSKYGFTVEAIEKKQYHGREISSTYIKEELKKGNISKAEELLGYSYTQRKK